MAFGEGRPHQALGGPVGGGDRRPVSLGLHLQIVATEPPEGEPAGLAGQVDGLGDEASIGGGRRGRHRSILVQGSCCGNRPETGLGQTGGVPSSATLNGVTVAVTADRRAEEQAELLRRRGARVVLAPTIRTLPLGPDKGLRAAIFAVMEEPPDFVVLTTGIGTMGWLAAAESVGVCDRLLGALSGATVLARGPKAVGAAATAGLEVA
ncbi:hypothetical protein BH18ACT4_BH18ACT4_06230 [soil metagenome]